MHPVIRTLAVAGLFLLGSCAAAQAQVTSNVVSDDFTGASASLPWVATGGACLTAGDATTQVLNGIGIPACGTTDYKGKAELGGYSGAMPDVKGEGALRLTNDANVFEQGGVIDTQAFPTSQGIQITFSTYTYDALQNGSVREYNDGTCPSGQDYICSGHGGDGILFFLLSVQAGDDGQPAEFDTKNLPVGGAGGSLGYSCNNRNYGQTTADPTYGVDGMPDAYIGLGMDDGGFYLDHTDNTSTEFTTQIPETIGLRGSGNVNWAWLRATYPNDYGQALTTTYSTSKCNGSLCNYAELAVAKTCETGYVWDYSTPSSPKETSTAIPYDYNYLAAAHLPSTTPMSSVYTTKRSAAYPITYRLIITPSDKLSLEYNWNNTGFKTILPSTSITASNGTLPPYFRFGFAGTAGGASNIHEITCFEASPAARTIGAPVAPLTVSTGSLLYTVTSNQSPVQGYVTAYALGSDGSAATKDTWEAGSLMSAAGRQQALYSTESDGSTVQLLTNLETETPNAFVTNTCAPSAATIVDYTIDPGSVSAPSGCAAYLGSRASGSLLDGFSQGDAAALLTPPHDALDLLQPGYSSFAAAEAKRASALLFTNDDGFLYSIDAAAGTLNWAWMPRAFLGQLQNYTSWPYADNFAGNFTVADASTTTSSTNGNTTSWGTYIVGSAQGGALWYDLALDKNGNPSKVVTTFLPYQATMASNTQALPDGTSPVSYAYPQRQAPVVGNVGDSQWAAFVVNTTSGTTNPTTTSTLYEFNVATGQSNYATIPSKSIGGGIVSSNLFYDTGTGALFFGSSVGGAYVMSFTGSASADVGNIGLLGTSEDGLAVDYIGYQQVGTQPYLWTASQTGLTVFGISNVGWNPLYATSPSAAYTYGSGKWTKVTGTGPAVLQATATISALPIVVDNILVVPVYVPPASTACNAVGNGYYDFYSLADGSFPKNAITQDGNAITGDFLVGLGAVYTPSYSLTSNSLPVYGSSQNAPTPDKPLVFSRSQINNVVQWRVH